MIRNSYEYIFSMIFTHLCRKWMNSPGIYSKKGVLHQNGFLRNSFSYRNFYSDNAKFQLSRPEVDNLKKKTVRNYVVALGVLTLGMSFAAVPLYRIFCQATGFGGTSKTDVGGEKIQNIKKVPYRPIKVMFTSDVGTNLQWKFKPQQKELTVIPGETALAFYSAKNPLDKPIIGISTYNIIPFEAAQYFNKIQCFCFEEQILNPKEEVDLPVFFYIDPEFCEDPLMEKIDEIILSYTFFAAKNASPLLDLLNSSSQ